METATSVNNGFKKVTDHKFYLRYVDKCVSGGKP